MPIYDHQCQSCQYQAEVMRKISAPSVEACPECGKETFSKQLSAPSFQLNGSGWYATDFKNSGAKPTTAPASSTDTTPSAATSTKPTNAAKDATP